MNVTEYSPNAVSASIYRQRKNYNSIPIMNFVAISLSGTSNTCTFTSNYNAAQVFMPLEQT